MAAQGPIKDNKKLDTILEHLSARSPKYFIIVMLTLNTCAYLSDIVEIKLADITHGRQFTNPRNHITFLFDDEFYAYLIRYINSLSPGTVYLFPSRDSIYKPVTVPSLSLKLKELTEEIGESCSFIMFQKTFALRYFITHKDLMHTNLCTPGKDKEQIMNYLCLSDSEYQLYLSNAVHIERQEGFALYQLADSLINDTCCILTSYKNYIDNMNYQPEFEENSILFIKKLALLVDDYKKKQS